ncbi:unnamed protein product [Ranitomeya imitator]|uniref:Reverse transcriptase domain-containing protein n=1 Tax=Ranitomeya imitator TaxID=111125 RepID=A0ABN9MCG9_9NEOB|nr:unnamed protein product [Ranitomeya imitator]
MESLRSVIASLEKGEFLASVDIQDAYLHIPIFPPHQRFLWFAVNNLHFQFTALPFGLASAPRVFTKVMSTVVSILHSRVQAAGFGAKDAMREGPAMTSRSCDRNVITGPALIPTLGPEAAACTAHRRQDYKGPSEGELRLGFFEHLEGWYDDTVSSSHSIVLAKKEELKSELDLRCHLHQPRSQRVKMDVHNVRAAELRLHSERVDRHCEGIKQALSNLREESIVLIDQMKKETKNFRSKISGMHNTFLEARKSDNFFFFFSYFRLVALSNSLPSILDSHVSGVQTAMRNYRQHVEEMLGKLCDTNSDFIKSFRLFSEGGNFSPDEVEMLRKRLHKASATIAAFEGSIMVDLEGLESQCLEQATEVVKKSEDKFLSITTDMIFLENIQKLLTNLQVKIKALVADSNSQSQQINSQLEHLRKKTDACAHPNIDKEVVSSDNLYAFMKTVMEGVTKRSRYLSCLLDLNPVLQESPLQGPIATASRSDVASRQEGRVTFGTPDSLLNPSRIGKLALDDAAVGVIRNIMK